MLEWICRQLGHKTRGRSLIAKGMCGGTMFECICGSIRWRIHNGNWYEAR